MKRSSVKRYSCLSGRQAINAKILLFCVFSYCILNLMGCSMLKEGAKGFMGTSTRILEERRKDAIVEKFDYAYPILYAKVVEILTRTHAYIYEQGEKKHMVAFYMSKYNTTVVGVFFQEINAQSTQIEVSSRSTYAKELISRRISSVLKGEITLGELEAKINANEEEERKERDQQDY